jgi:hypothetical protein
LRGIYADPHHVIGHASIVGIGESRAANDVAGLGIPDRIDGLLHVDRVDGKIGRMDMIRADLAVCIPLPIDVKNVCVALKAEHKAAEDIPVVQAQGTDIGVKRA